MFARLEATHVVRLQQPLRLAPAGYVNSSMLAKAVRRARIAGAAVALALVAACSSKPPSCADEQTLGLARTLLARHFVGSDYHGENIRDVLVFEGARPSNYEEGIKKYSCEATLVVNSKVRAPIAYTSQLTDDKKHIVSVQQLEGNFYSLAGNFMSGWAKVRDAQQAGPAKEPAALPAPSLGSAGAKKINIIGKTGDGKYNVYDLDVPAEGVYMKGDTKYSENEVLDSLAGVDKADVDAKLDCDFGVVCKTKTGQVVGVLPGYKAIREKELAAKKTQ
jgi:hypothetical protein